MYNTSKDYKEKVLEDSTQHELNIYIDENKIEPNHIIDFSSTSELFNNNEFCLGCTPERDIEFEIDKRDLPETYNEVYVETGVKYHEDVITEGEELTLKEEKEIPLNLEIGGNHKQVTYSGKNLYSLPSEQTINGIKVSHNEDGTFNLVGTAIAETYIVVSTTNIFKDKKIYTISKNTTNIGIVGYEYNVNTWLQTFVSFGKNEKNKTFTYNKNSNMTRNVLQINIANGTVLNEKNIKIMLEENSKETGWEPYVGGIPSPNPDYPSEIKTVGNQGSIKITKCNKNLLDLTQLTENYLWQCTETINNGVINLISNSSVGVSFARFNNSLILDTNKTYTISANTSADFGGFKVFYPLLGEYSSLGEKTLTFKPKESIVRLVFYVKINKSCTISNIQVEENVTATTFEEHQEQSYIMPAQQEMLENDYFDFDNEEEIHNWKKKILDGKETYTKATEGFYINTSSFGNMDMSPIICDKLINYSYNEFIKAENAIGYLYSAYKQLYIKIKGINTVEELKAWLSNNNMIVYYKLETPTRLPFTDEQKIVAKEIKSATTYEGTTHIYSTDEISPKLKTTCGSEIVPIGHFIIQTIEDDEFKVKIKATDYMKKFEDINYDGSNLTYPKTMLEVLKDICEKVGVELGSTSFINSDKEIAVYDNTVTARTYLGYIAEQAGGIAVVGRDGKLYIKQIGENAIDFNINLFGDYKWGDKFKVSKVSYEDGIQDYKFGDETQATVYIDQNNMYIVDREQVENVYEQIKDFEVYTFEGETIIDPSYDVGDILVIDGKKVLYQGEIEYAGKFKANIKSTIQAKNEQESMQTKQSNSNKIKRVQSKINQIDGKITQLVQETSEHEEKITQAQQDIDGFTQKVATKDEVTEKVNELKHTIEGITLQSKETGGGNIFFYAKEYWRGQEQDSEATLEEYTNTLIQQNNVSDEGYLINNGVSIQSQAVKNSSYAISFNYYKLKKDATGYIKINNTKYLLDGNANEWNEMINIVEITSNSIEIEIGSDTDVSFYISDLMVVIGVEKQIWSQNPNETRTDSVTIGKGIQVNSTTTNTYTRIDSDGNRTFNGSTNERVAEMTDKGVYANELEVKGQAKINSLLIQEIDGQVWITGIGG